jgi:hypothetical protein
MKLHDLGILAQSKMPFSISSWLIPLMMLVPAGTPVEQKPLKDERASPLNADFEKLVYETLDLWRVPGVAIGVVDADLEWSQVRIEISLKGVSLINQIFQATILNCSSIVLLCGLVLHLCISSERR